jgi:hypothetical protein
MVPRVRNKRFSQPRRRLWRDHGERQHARELPAPVCGWWCGSFDSERNESNPTNHLDWKHRTWTRGGDR